MVSDQVPEIGPLSTLPEGERTVHDDEPFCAELKAESVLEPKTNGAH